MKIAILGAGVIGVTTAIELNRDGHNVIVIDRQPDVGLETSFANAGLIAPGHSYAWETKGMQKKILKSLFSNNEVFRFRPKFDFHLFRWGFQFLKEYNHSRFIENTKIKLQLCKYSQKKLHELIQEFGLEYNQVQNGLMYIFRTKQALEEGKRNAELLLRNELDLEFLSKNKVLEIEPSLNLVKDKIYGAIYAPKDEAGDTYQFTKSLKKECQKKGVKFLFNTNIYKLIKENQKIRSIKTDKGMLEADAFIISLGSFSSKFVKSLGMFIPIYPVKGYSITMPISSSNLSVIGAGVDEHQLLAYARFGQKVRFTSIAEISNYNTNHIPKDFDYLIKAIKDIFPYAGDFSKINYWSGLRPMTPSGIPIIGKSKIDNLFFNTGHGHLGWTMACGSARICADIIKGTKTKLTEYCKVR